ncbi:cytochrome P450 [Kitasatospora sp. NPDC018619]|uniref:cytochrome P450 n=1 Tax=unclassified Kitasatospora TaxID=2633591 RepID=UPI0037B983AC
MPEELTGTFRGMVARAFSTVLGPQESAAAVTAFPALPEELIAEPVAVALLVAGGDQRGGQVLAGPTRPPSTRSTTASPTCSPTPTSSPRCAGGRVGWDDVVQEALRRAAPVAHLPMRYAVEDTELPGGVTVRGGEAVLAAYAAVGRHPQRCGDTGADFDVTRPVEDHLAFGHGAHFCPGALPARREGRTALGRLFARFPGLAPAPGVRLEPVLPGRPA